MGPLNIEVKKSRRLRTPGLNCFQWDLCCHKSWLLALVWLRSFVYSNLYSPLSICYNNSQIVKLKALNGYITLDNQKNIESVVCSPLHKSVKGHMQNPSLSMQNNNNNDNPLVVVTFFSIHGTYLSSKHENWEEKQRNFYMSLLEINMSKLQLPAENNLLKCVSKHMLDPAMSCSLGRTLKQDLNTLNLNRNTYITF